MSAIRRIVAPATPQIDPLGQRYISTRATPNPAAGVHWDLSDLYAGPDDPRLEEEVAGAEAAAAAFHERYHGAVAGLDAAELAEGMAEKERIESALDRALTFAHLRHHTNMADAARGALVSRLQERATAVETQLLFFGLEWAAVEDEVADRLLADPALDHWRHVLRSLRKFRPYLLSEPEERIVTEKTVSGASAWSRLYEELLGALRVQIDGEELSLEPAMAASLGGASRRPPAPRQEQEPETVQQSAPPAALPGATPIRSSSGGFSFR